MSPAPTPDLSELKAKIDELERMLALYMSIGGINVEMKEWSTSILGDPAKKDLKRRASDNAG